MTFLFSKLRMTNVGDQTLGFMCTPVLIAESAPDLASSRSTGLTFAYAFTLICFYPFVCMSSINLLLFLPLSLQ